MAREASIRDDAVIWEIDEDSRTIEGLDDRGRALPAYAASLGMLPAPVGRRVAATAIEVGIYLTLQLPLLLGALPALLAVATAADPRAALVDRGDLVLIIVCALASSVLTTAYVLTQLILHGRRGVTVGKALLGLRSVNVRTLEKPGFWRGAVVRYLVLVGSFVVALVGPLVVIALSPLFDRDRRGRGWPDLAAATWIVDIRRGLNPYDVKRMRIARKTVATDLRDERDALPSLATATGEQPVPGFVPTARSRGGVLGAPRLDAGPGASPAAAGAPSAPPVPAVPAPAAPAPLAVPASPGIPASLNAWAPPVLMDPAPAPRGPVAVTLTLDSGEVIAVEGGGVLLGRAPARSADDAGMTEVRVADPTMSISKTHLAVIRAGDTVHVEDRWSTNGSSVVTGGVDQALIAGERRPLRHGDTIRFGDRRARVAIG